MRPRARARCGCGPVRADRGSGFAPESSFRYDPGEGAFFRLGTDDLNVFTQVVNGG